MSGLLILLTMLVADAPAAAPRGAIEATIRGTKQPLDVELLVRDASDQWKEVGHQTLPSDVRRVRFEALESGVYQILVRGPQKTEQFATKVGVGRNDLRRITIHIDAAELTGHVTLGGVDLGTGGLVLNHKEFRWKAAIPLAADGTFRVPLWQRGDYLYSIRGASLATAFTDNVTLDGASPLRFAVDIPDGRITGIVRDAKSGAPIAGAAVALQTNADGNEQHVRLMSDAEGRFDFTGVKYGTHTVRSSTPTHLEPAPIVFDLDATTRLRELDVRLDAGRAVPILVIDAENDPVDQARVFAIAGAKLWSRAMTDQDGRTTIAVPEGEPVTLFVVPA
ncbi:MAG TPA: carboxypeptidase-like regulatory domain-containing protein, partial [Thermoanaerobaculia bacterium]